MKDAAAGHSDHDASSGAMTSSGSLQVCQSLLLAHPLMRIDESKAIV